MYGSVLAEEDITAGVWPPAPVLKAYAWWCEHIDPLLAHNPSWYNIIICIVICLCDTSLLWTSEDRSRGVFISKVVFYTKPEIVLIL